MPNKALTIKLDFLSHSELKELETWLEESDMYASRDEVREFRLEAFPPQNRYHAMVRIAVSAKDEEEAFTRLYALQGNEGNPNILFVTELQVPE